MKNETLFSLAWRYEKNLQKLAAVNRIAPPYTIYPGQRLNLDTSQYVAIVQPARNTHSTVKKQQKRSNPSIKPAAVARAKVKSTTATHKKSISKLSKNWRWSWPVKGRMVRSFGADKFFKGIDVVSLPGAPVYPAAPGVVVYSGSGLRGYGKLIIIKHSEVYLSAYAHNRKVFVVEGDTVAVNKKIAAVGGDPNNSRRFYFEIRKDGKPVNPLNYLP